MVAAPPDGAALVARLRTRDRQAWEELYELYEPRLSRFAYRLTGNSHDAADLVQETFVRALPRLDRLDPEQLNLSAYLFTTAKNIFLNQAERRGRVALVEDVPEPDVERPIEDEPERLSLLHDQQEEVRAANAALPPRQRLVLALRELEDRSYAEIGEIVGLNENAVAQLISRARDNLRHELRLSQVDRSKLPRECQALLPALSAHLDGRLKGPEQEGVIAHLEACPSCQEALTAMAEARRRYRALLPPTIGTAELKTRTERALGAAGYWNRAPRGRLRRRRRLAAGAAAAGGVSLLVAAGLVLGLPSRHTAASSSGTESVTTIRAVAPATIVAAHPATVHRPHRSLPHRRTVPRPPAVTTTVAPPTTQTATAAPGRVATPPAIQPRAKSAKRQPTRAKRPELVLVASARGLSVHNAGDAAAKSFSVRLSDGTHFPFSTLAAGATASRSFACTTAARTASISPAADTPTATIPACPPAPKLTFAAADARGFTVHNAGEAPARSFSVRLSDGTHFPFSTLAAGGSASRSFACTTAARTASISPAAGTPTATIPACPPAPKLTFAAADARGFTVHNAGEAPARSFSVRLSDGTHFPFSTLAAGGSASRSFACTTAARTASISPVAGTPTATIPPCPRAPKLAISAANPTALTVSNSGTATAAAFTVTLSDGTQLGFGSLAPGASASQSFTCAIATRTASISPAGDTTGEAAATIPACPPVPKLTFAAADARGFTVHNAGEARAKSFSVRLSDGTDFGFSTLAAGASASRSFTCAPATRTASISPAADTIAGSATATIPACPTAPNLTISAAEPTTLTVSNTGTGPAAAFTVTLSDGTQLSFGTLAPGASASQSFTCTTATRTASISPAADTTAGSATATIPACPPAPNLTISAADPTTLTVSNTGSGPAAAFTVTLSDGTQLSFGTLAPGASASQSFTCTTATRTASISPAADTTAGSATTTIPACPPPAPSSLALTCPSGGPVGAAVLASGALTPALAGSVVTVTYTTPRSATITHMTTTDANGAFSDSVTLPAAGRWTAQAQWPGDATRQPASAPPCSFNIG